MITVKVVEEITPKVDVVDVIIHKAEVEITPRGDVAIILKEDVAITPKEAVAITPKEVETTQADVVDAIIRKKESTLSKEKNVDLLLSLHQLFSHPLNQQRNQLLNQQLLQNRL